MLRRCLIALFAVTLIATAGYAQQAVPTPEEFLGYRLGEQFTPHQRILDYFGELTKRSDLVTLQTFGQTYERRPLVLVTITSPKNRAALESIRTNVNALAQGDAIDANRVAEIARTSPAVVWAWRSSTTRCANWGERSRCIRSRARARASFCVCRSLWRLLKRS